MAAKSSSAVALPPPPPEAPPPPPEAAEVPTEPTDEGDAMLIVSAIVSARDALARIHARQVPATDGKPGRDGTAAVGAMAKALLIVGGRIPNWGGQSRVWALKHPLDQARYSREKDPHGNLAFSSLVPVLIECFEEGRKRPEAHGDHTHYVADTWSGFAHRAEAVAHEDATRRGQETARTRAAEADYSRRAALAQSVAQQPAREPQEVPEPTDVTVG